MRWSAYVIIMATNLLVPIKLKVNRNHYVDLTDVYFEIYYIFLIEAACVQFLMYLCSDLVIEGMPNIPI